MAEKIRDYQRLRRILEPLFTYTGCFSREDFERLGLSRRSSYDKETLRLKSLFNYYSEESPMQDELRERRRHLQIQRGYFSNLSALLGLTYRLHSFSEEEREFCLAVLHRLAQKPQTFTELLQSETFVRNAEGTTFSSENTMRRWLHTLVREGYLKREGRTYRLAPSPLEGRSEEELTGLYCLALFYEETGFPRVAASFLKESIAREMLSRGYPLPEREPFLFRGNTSRSVFDEEMVYRILNACETETELRVTSDHGRQILRPVYLKADTRLGRWYLFGATEQGAELVRLSKITEMEPLSTHFDYREAEAQVERILGDSLISQGNRRTTIEAELHFENEPGQRKQFEREMLCGRILLRGETEIYQAELNDVGELLPFLRSYGPYLKILPGEHGLDEKLRGEWRRMLDVYEAVP